MLRRVGGSWFGERFRMVAGAALLLVPIAVPAAADDPVSRPRANEVCLFSGPNFEGASSCVATGILNAALASIFNDRISSIRVGSAAAIEVCGEAFFGGWCQMYRGDVAELPAEQNNAITSYRVMTLPAADAVLTAQMPAAPPPEIAPPITPPADRPATPPDMGQLVPAATIITPDAMIPAPAGDIAPPVGGPSVCFFSEPNFAGESFCALAKDAGNISGLWDDRISSIRVAGKVAVQVCQSRDFFGWCERIDASLAQLPGGRDDAISSFRFQ